MSIKVEAAESTQMEISCEHPSSKPCSISSFSKPNTEWVPPCIRFKPADAAPTNNCMHVWYAFQIAAKDSIRYHPISRQDYDYYFAATNNLVRKDIFLQKICSGELTKSNNPCPACINR